MSSFIYSGKVRFPAQVEQMMYPLESVRQFESNPNNGDLDAISESIVKNGFTSIITVDAKTKQIVAGNHRWQALLGLGATHAPMLFVDYESDIDAKRFLVGDNRTGQLARPDDAMLVEILKELHSSADGLQGTGYDQDSMMDLIASLKQSPLDEIAGRPEPALLGIYEATVSFESKAERDEFYEDMIDRFGEEEVRRLDA